MKMSTKRNTRRQLKMESLEDRKLMTVMVEFAEMGVRDPLRSEIPSLWTSGGTTSVKVGHELGKLKMGGQEGEALAKNIAIEKVTDAIFAGENDGSLVNMASPHCPIDVLDIWTSGAGTRAQDSMHQGAMNSVAGNTLQHGSDALHVRLSQTR